jgi:NAD(P)H-hydrate epimerase
LASNQSPKEAVILAMYLHGFAGDKAKKKYTEYAMNAAQIIDCIPKAFKQLEK